MTDLSFPDLLPGLNNLLLNCVKADSGNRILLIGEEGENCYFDTEICTLVAKAVKKAGMIAEVITAPPVKDSSAFPSHIKDAMMRADKTIFFSRLGDQVRFNLEDGISKAVIAYIPSQDYLASSFAQADYDVMMSIHNALLERVFNAKSYQLKGACGTNLTGTLLSERVNITSDFALKLFPVMIFPPINCHHMSGQLSIQHFVTSTSTRAYENSSLVLDESIMATVEEGRMTSFDGSPKKIAALISHLERAASLTGGDPFMINSWHTGINPGTYYLQDPYSDLEKWGTIAYGSPRYTHMHAAGNDPGDVAFHLMDLSIYLDDEIIWDQGCFIFLDQPDIQALIPDDQKPLLNSSVRNNIGL